MRKRLTKEQVNRTITGWWEALEQIPVGEQRERQRVKVQEQVAKLQADYETQEQTLQIAWDACCFINSQNPLAVAQSILKLYDACKSAAGFDPNSTYTQLENLKTKCLDAINSVQSIPTSVAHTT